MIENLNPELYPAGSALLLGPDSFLKDLSEEDESMIGGGKRSRTNSRSERRRRRKRRRRKNRRRANRSRSCSRTN